MLERGSVRTWTTFRTSAAWVCGRCAPSYPPVREATFDPQRPRFQIVGRTYIQCGKDEAGTGLAELAHGPPPARGCS